MKIKNNKGFAGVDMIIAVIAITIFSTLILSLMGNNVIENLKLTKETMAMIYITEIFENVGIQPFDSEVYNIIGTDYTEITEENILVPEEVINNYKVEMAATTELDGVTNNENILKKIKIKLTYQVANKDYVCSMERMKIKE